MSELSELREQLAEAESALLAIESSRDAERAARQAAEARAAAIEQTFVGFYHWAAEFIDSEYGGTSVLSKLWSDPRAQAGDKLRWPDLATADPATSEEASDG